MLLSVGRPGFAVPGLLVQWNVQLRHWNSSGLIDLKVTWIWYHCNPSISWNIEKSHLGLQLSCWIHSYHRLELSHFESHGDIASIEICGSLVMQVPKVPNLFLRNCNNALASQVKWEPLLVMAQYQCVTWTNSRNWAASWIPMSHIIREYIWEHELFLVFSWFLYCLQCLRECEQWQPRIGGPVQSAP